MEISKHDWSLYQELLPIWQEQHMDDLIQEYIAILSRDENPSARFWALEKRIRQDQRHSGVRAEVSKDTMLENLVSLLHEDVISMDDLCDFSGELQDLVYKFLLKTI